MSRYLAFIGLICIYVDCVLRWCYTDIDGADGDAWLVRLVCLFVRRQWDCVDADIRAMPPSRRIRFNMRAVKRMPVAAGIVLT